MKIEKEASAPAIHYSSLSIRIADITFNIKNARPDLKLQVVGSSREFLVHGTPPEIAIEARWQDLSVLELKQGKQIFDSGSLWQLYRQNGDYVFSLISPAFGQIPYKVAFLRKDYSKGEVLLHKAYFDPEQPVNPLNYPLDELILINYLSSGRGIEVHACGLVDSLGQGHLFAGHSEAGKTTTARLWEGEPGITILSDDRIVLRKIENKIWMYGTPWHGDARLASPERAPLSRIYFLRHGEKNELVKQRKNPSLMRLMACSFLPYYNPQAIDFSLTFFEEIVSSVPCHELSFLPDKSVVEYLQKEIGLHS